MGQRGSEQDGGSSKLENFRILLEALNKSKTSVLIILMLFYLVYTFKQEIKEILVNINYESYTEENIVKKRLNNDVLINNSLQDLMIETKSDRAYIFRFHNGVNYYTGTHKGRFSCDYEVVRKGVSKESKTLQDLSNTLYSDFILACLEYKMIHYNINNIQNERVKQTLKEQGIKGLAVFPYYRDNHLIAMIGVDYISPTSHLDQVKFDNHKDEIVAKFTNRITRIGDLLE